ncbi:MULTISPECIES: SRPBCC family protein [unclassified Mesorhizobium]|uniref:SRPBCC family protein n=1 Tax=unclassified Mesorhizobium TaxID=325217 RepID=UPI0026D9AE85
MSTHQPPVRHSILVEAPIAHAFKVFTEDFGSFKPKEHNLLAVPIAETIFEPRVGGHVYDRGVDGSECRWARVLAYEPPNRLLLSWDISPQWQIETNPDRTSEWEVRFTAETNSRTPASRSSIAISNVMAKAGKACALGLTVIEAGRCISGDSKIFLPAR